MKNERLVPGPAAKLTLISFVILVFFIYLPAFVTSFGMHNDYSFLGYDPSENWLGFPETDHLFAIGRPIGAVLLNVHGLFLRSLESFDCARFVSLVVSLVSAWLVLRYLADQLQVDVVVSTAIAFCMLLLPSGQVYVLWLTNFVPGALNVLLSLLCYRILERAGPQELLRGNRRSLGWATAAFAFFIFNLSIYPPTALTFLALTFANILYSPTTEWPRVRYKVIRDLLFAGLGMLVYLAAFKLIVLPLFYSYGSDVYRETVDNINGEGEYRFQMTTNLAEKVGEFGYLSTLAIGGSLHAIVGNTSAWIMGGLTVAAFGYVAFRAARLLRAPGGLTWAVQKSAFAILIILFACAPSLMAERGQTGYRVVSTYQAIALLCLFAPLSWLSEMVANFPARRVAIGLALVSGWLAAWNVFDMARFANRELLFVRQKLDSADKDKLTTIMGVYRLPAANYLEWPLQLEFKCEIGNIFDFAGAVRAVLPDSGLGDRQLTFFYDQGRHQMTLPSANGPGATMQPLLLVFLGEGGLMITDEQTVLIDFNELSISGPRLDARLPSIRTSNSEGGRALFDPSSGAVWEPGSTPQWLEISVAQPSTFNQVTFYAGPRAEVAGDMPRDWHVMACNDEVNWVEIDSRSGQDNWAVGEKRTYSFAHPTAATHYLFVFTAANGPVLKLDKIGL